MDWNVPKVGDLISNGKYVVSQVREHEGWYDCGLIEKETGERGNLRLFKTESGLPKRKTWVEKIGQKRSEFLGL